MTLLALRRKRARSGVNSQVAAPLEPIDAGLASPAQPATALGRGTERPFSQDHAGHPGPQQLEGYAKLQLKVAARSAGVVGIALAIALKDAFGTLNLDPPTNDSC